jgi:hypothetical protein
MKEKKEKETTVIYLEGKPFTVPPGGTLGVLALGSVGVRAWRKAKIEWLEQNANSNEKK